MTMILMIMITITRTKWNKRTNLQWHLTQSGRNFSPNFQTDSAAPLPSLLFNEYQGSVPEIQRLRPEADHLPPSSANVKNEWSHTSTPPIRLHGMGRYFLFSLKIH